MFSGTQEGLFWFSDNPERSVPGTLSVGDRGRLELTTRGFLQSHINLSSRETTPGTICGVTDGGTVILAGATASGRKQTIHRYISQIQEIWLCQYGLQSDTEITIHREHQVTSIEVEIQALSDWADNGPSLQIDRENRLLSWPPNQDGPTAKWSLGQVGLRHTVRSSASGDWARYRSAELEIWTSFIVRFDQAQPQEVVLDTISSLQSLVSVAKGEPVALEKVSLTIDTGTTEQTALFHYQPILWPSHPEPKDSELFSITELSGIDGIAKWLNALRDQPHVVNGLLIDRYYRSPFVTDVTLHRLLACEAYQRSFKNSVGSRISLAETLPVLDNIGPRFLEWIGGWQAWLRNISWIRNNLVAHLQAYGRPLPDGNKVESVNRQLYAYLIIRILAACDVDDELIEQVIDRASSEVVRHLP